MFRVLGFSVGLVVFRVSGSGSGITVNRWKSSFILVIRLLQCRGSP